MYLLQMQSTNLSVLAPTIEQLEDTKAIQKANYDNFASTIEKLHEEKAMNTGNAAPNIRWLQNPSPPTLVSTKTSKMVGELAFGGIFAGLALAFLIEFFLDRSVRRPAEIVSKLKMLLFLSIPDVSRNGHARLAGAAARRQLAESTAPDGAGRRPPPGRAMRPRMKAAPCRWSRWSATPRCIRSVKRCVTA